MPLRTFAIAFIVTTTAINTAQADDWIIGATDPHELVILTTDREVDGGVTIINSGRLEIQNAELSLHGDITLTQNASLLVNGGKIRFDQTYSYQRRMLAIDDSNIRFENARIDTGGPYACSVTMLGNSSADFDNVSIINNGGATWTFWDTASLEMNNCNRGDEFVFMGNGDISIANTDWVMFWFTLPDGSVVDTALPDPGTVASWSVGPDSAWASGIPYRATITNCTNVHWGLMATSGSTATIRNSDIYAIGTLFERDNTVEITGIANNQHITDSSYNWGDVTFHLLDTSVKAWNFYAFGATKLTLKSCVFGEMLANGTAHVIVDRSLCDGSGGYCAAEDNSTVIFNQSTNLSQTVCRDNAAMWVSESALLGPDIHLSGSSTMALVNTEYRSDPVVHDSALALEASIEPVEISRGAELALRGSARILTAPNTTLPGNYSVYYGQGYNPDQWFSLISQAPAGVQDDTLATWNTCNIPSGVYALSVNLHLGASTPVSATAIANILPGTFTPSDADCDGQVDLTDWALLNDCLSGPADGSLSLECQSRDIEQDGKIDLADFARFQQDFATGG